MSTTGDPSPDLPSIHRARAGAGKHVTIRCRPETGSAARSGDAPEAGGSARQSPVAATGRGAGRHASGRLHEVPRHLQLERPVARLPAPVTGAVAVELRELALQAEVEQC